MKQSILGKLERFKKELQTLKKEVSEVEGKPISRMGIRNRADSIATMWVEVWWTPFFGQKKTPSLDRAAALKMKESQCPKPARVTHPA